MSYNDDYDWGINYEKLRNVEDAVAEMKRLYEEHKNDNEALHIIFDKIVVALCDKPVAEYYKKIEDEKGFWHA